MMAWICDPKDHIRYMIYYAMSCFETLCYVMFNYIVLCHLTFVVSWYDMIWYDMIWYDMIWYDMIWYDMICCVMLCCVMLCCVMLVWPRHDTTWLSLIVWLRNDDWILHKKNKQHDLSCISNMISVVVYVSTWHWIFQTTEASVKRHIIYFKRLRGARAIARWIVAE